MNKPDGQFWELVRSEIRATWCGRFQWLWRIAALGVAVTGVVVRAEGINGWFSTLVALCSWLPAFLCSDLLSLNFKGNPEPQREWPFRAIAARAMGRLAPFFAAQTLWIAPYLLRSILASASTQSSVDPLRTQGGIDTVPLWIAWICVFLAAGLPYATTAGLLSGLFRRPRRPLVTLATVTLGVIFASMYQYFAGGIFKSPGSLPSPDEVGSLFAIASFNLGVGAAGTVLGLLPAVDAEAPIMRWIDRFSLICYSATFTFLAYALIAAFLIRSVVRRRERRHPFSGNPGAPVSGSVVSVAASGI